MKNKILTFLLLVSGIFMASCSREEYKYNLNVSGEGQIDLRGLNVRIDQEPLTRAENSLLKDFMVRIYEKTTGTIQKQWVYSEMPEIATLKAGAYRIDVVSHNLQPAEFDKPYYMDSKLFEIRENEVTQVEKMVCKLANIKVTVEYDMELALLLGDDVQVKTQIGDGILVFGKGDVKAGYFAPAADLNILTAELTGTIDGEKMKLIKVFSDVKAGEHRVIRYTLKNTDPGNNNETGTPNLSVKVDASCTIYDKDIVVGVDEGVIEDGDQPVVPDQPVDPEPPVETANLSIKGVDFDIKQAIVIPAEGMTVQVDIKAEKGLQNLFVVIDSETLTADILQTVGLATKFDLANPGTLQEALSSLGFPVGDQVLGQTFIKFDISQFTPLLGVFGPGTHKFIITIVDADNSQLTETLTLISNKP